MRKGKNIYPHKIKKWMLLNFMYPTTKPIKPITMQKKTIRYTIKEENQRGENDRTHKQNSQEKGISHAHVSNCLIMQFAQNI